MLEFILNNPKYDILVALITFDLIYIIAILIIALALSLQKLIVHKRNSTKKNTLSF